MTETRARVHTGGCQCGAVRYALLAEPYEPHICHCRMCQKAFGGPFAPLAVIDLGDFEWTRGRPATFASSTTWARAPAWSGSRSNTRSTSCLAAESDPKRRRSTPR